VSRILDRTLLLFPASCLSLLLSACVGVPLASSDADEAAKRFEVSDEESVLYFVRHGLGGAAINMFGLVDDIHPVVLAPATYTTIVLAPGDHRLAVGRTYGQNPSITTPTSASISFHTTAGSVTIVKSSFGFGRINVEVAEEEAGRKLILESRLTARK
jgi:hypothetical protein